MPAQLELMQAAGDLLPVALTPRGCFAPDRFKTFKRNLELFY